MIMPLWLFGYCLFGAGLYWALQTFLPHPVAGWTAFGVTVVLWYFIRRGRKAIEREQLAKAQAEHEFLLSELAELEERRRADAASSGA